MRYSYAFLTAILTISACSTGPVRRTYSKDSDGKDSSEVSANATATPAPVKANPIKKAQSEYTSGNHAAALTTLKGVDPDSLKPSAQTEYWNLRGLVELANREATDAEDSFRKAIAANPNPEFIGYYQYNLASAYADEKRTDDAIQELNKINLTQMDKVDQKKIALLKDKLLHGQTGSLVVTATPSPTPVAAATPTKDVYQGPVKANRIGVLLPLSGKYETFGKKVQKAIELAFQNSPITKEREIELVPVDSGDTPASHQEALKKLVEEDQVIAIIGPLLSKGIEALPTSSDFYQIPVVSIAQVQGIASPHIFSCSVSLNDQASKIVDYAMTARGFKKFAILAPSNKPGEEMARAFWDQVTAHGGEIKAYETYEPGLTDFREPVDKTLGLFYKETRWQEIKALADKRKEMDITRKTMKTEQYFALPPIIDFDAVFIADEAKTVGQIIPTFTYRDAKNLPYLGITTWNSPQLISRAAEGAEGATFPVAFNTLNPPAETKAFYDLYSSTYSAPPGELDATAYDAASAVIEVLKDKPSTREEFNTKLSQLGKVDGATGPFAIKDQHCSRDLALYTVKKGEFQTVKPGTNEEPAKQKANPTPTPEPTEE